MATEQQIPKLIGQISEHQRFLGALTTEDAQWALQHTREALALFTEALTNRGDAQQFGLHFSHSMDVRIPVNFSARRCFRVGTIDGVKIKSVSDDFRGYYLKPADITTPDIRPKDAHCRVFLGHELMEDAKEFCRRRGFLLKGLHLSCVWSLLKLASADSPYSLESSGWPNAILTIDSMGNGYFVVLRWRPLEGWEVDSSQISTPKNVTGLINYIVGS